MAQETYGELRRRKRAKGLYDDTRPNINERVNDRSPDNDSEDMREQARTDRLRAEWARGNFARPVTRPVKRRGGRR